MRHVQSCHAQPNVCDPQQLLSRCMNEDRRALGGAAEHEDTEDTGLWGMVGLGTHCMFTAGRVCLNTRLLVRSLISSLIRDIMS